MTYLEQALRYIALAGIFALPFIVFLVTTSLFFPFITGKNFAFRIIIEIIAGAWLALALVSPAYRPRRSWILAAVSVFTLIILFADLSGVNPFKSIWSNFERMDGWVTLAHLALYIVVAVSMVNTEKLWRRLFQLSIAISVVVCVYGLLQLVGVRALGQAGAAGLGARLDATFGNPIYLAVYLLFHIFIAALVWFQEWKERPQQLMSLSFLYGGIIVLETIILFFTGTRGTVLGLIGGVFIAAVILARFSTFDRVRKIAVGTLLALVVLLGVYFAIRTSGVLRNVGFIDRLATISFTDATIKSRLLNIGMAWEGFKERPILGWGQENYAIVFDKYFDPRMYAQEPWFDRVHNVVFDWLVAGGLLGLLSYLSIFGAVLLALWRGLTFSTEEASILTGLFAAYFFHNLFVFDNITSYILFATMLAYIAWRYGESSASARVYEGKLLAPAMLPIVAVVAIVVVWAGAWYVNGRALSENRALLSAIGRQNSDVLINLADFKKAISYGATGTQETREQLAQAAASLVNASVSTEAKQQFFDAAVQEMTLQAQESPLDARFPLFLGMVFAAYGDTASAKTALDRARLLSPAKQSIIYEQGVNALARGANSEALGFFKTALELEESNKDARLLYAAAAIRLKEDALADQLLAPLIESGDAADARIAAAYASRGLYGKIVTIWKGKVAAEPAVAQNWFTLSAAYYAAHDDANAIKVLQELIAINPGVAAEAQGYIEQIKNGTAPRSQ